MKTIQMNHSPLVALRLNSLLLLLAAVAVVLLPAVSAHADIVADGGFESAAPGATANTWTQYNVGSSIDGGSWLVTAGSVGVDSQDNYVYDGNNSVTLNGDPTQIDSLSQTLATIVGQQYTIGFWADAEVNNAFSATFGGVALSGVPSSIAENGFPNSNYPGNSSQFVYYSGTGIATSTSTELTFSSTTLPTIGNGVSVEIDDVTATPTPEPGSIFLMLTGILGLGFVVARKHLGQAALNSANLA